MADFFEQRRAAKILMIVTVTLKWLDSEVSESTLDPKSKQLAQALRQYLLHCRRQVWAGNLSIEVLNRRERKIEEASFALWKRMTLRK